MVHWLLYIVLCGKFFVVEVVVVFGIFKFLCGYLITVDKVVWISFNFFVLVVVDIVAVLFRV